MNLDLIFSIGPACRPAYHLKQNFLRLFSSPLDWQMNYTLNTCLMLFRTSFNSFFTKIEENPQKRGSHNNRYVVDTQNLITSIHHFDSTLSLSEAQNNFRAIMRKRYLTLHNAILESKTTGLICNRNDSISDLCSFLSAFGEIYPNTSFLLINIRNNSSINGIIVNDHIITTRLRIREYSFSDIYTSPFNQKENFWIGNMNYWNNILQEYKINNHPYAEYLIHLNTQIVIYGAGKYCRKLLLFAKKYDIKISCILVTSMENNVLSIDDVPVIPFYNFPSEYKNATVIISVINQDESLKIYQILKYEQFKNILRLNTNLQLI